MDLLADENIPSPSIIKVRAAGIPLRAIREDSPSLPDHDILLRAAREHLVIWTLDSDFGDLIFRQGVANPAGVIYFRFTATSLEEPATILLHLLADPKIAIEGFFTVVDRNGYRQRGLP